MCCHMLLSHHSVMLVLTLRPTLSYSIQILCCMILGFFAPQVRSKVVDAAFRKRQQQRYMNLKKHDSVRMLVHMEGLKNHSILLPRQSQHCCPTVTCCHMSSCCHMFSFYRGRVHNIFACPIMYSEILLYPL